MVWRVLLITLAATAILMGGCKKKQPALPTEPAQVEVTPENLDTELDKMEAEINADIAAEQ